MVERTCETKDEAQALANFLWNEKERHLEDVSDIEMDLEDLEKYWDVRPRKERAFVRPGRPLPLDLPDEDFSWSSNGRFEEEGDDLYIIYDGWRNEN